MAQNADGAKQVHDGKGEPQPRAVSKRQPFDWQVLNATAIGGPSNARTRVDAVLLHPWHGIVLIDIAPHSTPRASHTLRQTLVAHGVRAWPTADIPIRYFYLKADELQGLPHILRTVFGQRHEALLLATSATHSELAQHPDHRWIDEVRNALTAIDQNLNVPHQINAQGLKLSNVTVIAFTLALLGGGFAVRGLEMAASLTGFGMVPAPSPSMVRTATDRVAGVDDPTQSSPPVNEDTNGVAILVDTRTVAVSTRKVATDADEAGAAVETPNGPATWPAVLVAPAVTPPPIPPFPSGRVPILTTPQTPTFTNFEAIAIPPLPVLPVRITDEDRVQPQIVLPSVPHPALSAVYDLMLPSSLSLPPVPANVGSTSLITTLKTPTFSGLPQSDFVPMPKPLPLPAPPHLSDPTILGQHLQAIEATAVTREVRQPVTASVAAVASVLLPIGSGYPVIAVPTQPSVTQSTSARVNAKPALSAQATLTLRHSTQPDTANTVAKKPATLNVVAPTTVSSRCGTLLARLQFLERLSDAERDLLRTACKPR